MRLLCLICIPGMLASCQGGPNPVDEFLSIGTFGAIGDSAFTSTPSSYDFGNISVGSDSSTTLTLKNSSNSAVYVSSITATSTHFSLVTDTCSRSPNPIQPNGTCTATVKFTPLNGGSQSVGLLVRYGVNSGASATYSSSFSIIGTGVSSLVFAGLQTITPITTKTFTLNWNAAAAANAFQVDGLEQTRYLHLTNGRGHIMLISSQIDIW